jgi:hypothetical protein
MASFGGIGAAVAGAPATGALVVALLTGLVTLSIALAITRHGKPRVGYTDT